jgi:DNA-binding transcriptional LysR family regulator
MLDGLSLDQLRTFIAAVEEGSFSAAGRRLRRSQSVVSELVSSLERQLGVSIFDRSGRYPALTEAGTVLLGDARSILSGVEGMKARANGMASGVEPEVSVAIDVLFPMAAVTAAAKDFQRQFPKTPLRIYAETLGGAYQPVLDGRARLGIVGPLPVEFPSVASERLGAISIVMVAARDHPLAAIEGVVPRRELAAHTQLVLTDRSDLSTGREFGVMSPLNWRLADLFAKHAFLLSGLGWGGMPTHVVDADLAEGRLVRLQIEDVPKDGLVLPMSAIHLKATPPGPAGRWLIERLNQCPSRALPPDLDARRRGDAVPQIGSSQDRLPEEHLETTSLIGLPGKAP